MLLNPKNHKTLQKFKTISVFIMTKNKKTDNYHKNSWIITPKPRTKKPKPRMVPKDYGSEIESSIVLSVKHMYPLHTIM